jgi:hypothetical protein
LNCRKPAPALTINCHTGDVQAQLRLECGNASNISAWSSGYADHYVIDLRHMQFVGDSRENRRKQIDNSEVSKGFASRTDCRPTSRD